MNEVALKIKIANREYPLTVDAGEADQIKRAAAIVNENIQKLKGDYVVTDYVDLLAMTALELANRQMETGTHLGADNHLLKDKLNDLTQRISNALQ